MDVNLTVSQVSRVAVIGANGAGKYTAVNVWVGVQAPFRAPSENRRPSSCVPGLARLHHLEKHMQETPTQYTMWCFAGNDHKESIEFKSDEISVGVEFACSVKWGIDGMTGSVRPCIDPKVDVQKEKTFVFEVKWHFKLIEANVWFYKDILIR